MTIRKRSSRLAAAAGGVLMLAVVLGAGAGAARPTGPVVTKVSGSRAADAGRAARVVYWKRMGKEATP